jgi:hypothetical protein
MHDEKVLAAFLRNVTPEPTSGCWLWVGPVNKKGYGYSSLPGHKHASMHRMSWALYRGPITPGAMVLHRCDNPPCVNPEHLFLGTNSDNSIDAVNKGRYSRSKISRSQAAEIKSALSMGARTVEMARRYGISPQSISNIRAGRTWGHVQGSAHGN